MSDTRYTLAETDFAGRVHDSDGDPVYRVVRLSDGTVLFSTYEFSPPTLTAREGLEWRGFAGAEFKAALTAWESEIDAPVSDRQRYIVTQGEYESDHTVLIVTAGDRSEAEAFVSALNAQQPGDTHETDFYFESGIPEFSATDRPERVTYYRKTTIVDPDRVADAPDIRFRRWPWLPAPAAGAVCAAGDSLRMVVITVDTDEVAARERHAARVAEVAADLRSGAGRQ